MSPSLLRAAPLTLLVATACGPAPVVEDAGSLPPPPDLVPFATDDDAGMTADAGVPDPAAPDAGAPDAGMTTDAGAPFAGLPVPALVDAIDHTFLIEELGGVAEDPFSYADDLDGFQAYLDDVGVLYLDPRLNLSVGLGGATIHLGVLSPLGRRFWKYGSYTEEPGAGACW